MNLFLSAGLAATALTWVLFASPPISRPGCAGAR